VPSTKKITKTAFPLSYACFADAVDVVRAASQPTPRPWCVTRQIAWRSIETVQSSRVAPRARSGQCRGAQVVGRTCSASRRSC